MADDDTIARESSQHSEPNSSGKRKKPRGASKGLKSKPGVSRFIEWDAAGRVIGPWKKDFVAHIGNISRTKVSILFEHWSQVPKGLKDTLWEDVRREFNMEDNAVFKREVLSKCDEAWKGFKCKLNKKYIKCAIPPTEPVFEKYSWISEQTWNDFVKLKTSEKSLETSEKAQMSASFNIYPHHMGQQAYAQKEPIWKSEGHYVSNLSPGNSSSSGAISSLPDRAISWVLARSQPDENGNLCVPNERTRIVQKAIKISDGEFVPKRSDDPLYRALGKNDHSGRVRGFGGHIGHRDVWGPSSRSNASMGMYEKGEVDAIIESKVKEQVKAQVEEFQTQILAALNGHGIKVTSLAKKVDTNSPVAPHYSSCHSGGLDPFDNLKGMHTCMLAIMQGVEKVNVAIGTFRPDLILDHQEIVRPGHVKVSIDKIRDGYENTPLPVPCTYVTLLGEAKGSFTQWKKHLVTLCSDDEALFTEKQSGKTPQSGQKPHSDVGNVTNESAINPKKVFNPENSFPYLTDKCVRLQAMVETNFGLNETINIGNMGKREFSYPKDEEISLVQEDISELIYGSRIGAPIMQVFMLALRDRYLKRFESNSIGFFCPQNIAATSLDPNPTAAVIYMRNTMTEQCAKRFILCPYHQENHWVLLVICLAQHQVYTFDPRKSSTDNFKLKLPLRQAFESFQISKGYSRMQRTQQKLSWSSEQCAQQEGITECGYYVMRYMLEIVQHHHASSNLSKDFLGRMEPYFEEEINEARDLVAEYIVSIIAK